jgi:hypothetical protein
MVALSYWRTGCRVLGKVLGELTRRLGKPLVKPNPGPESAEIAPRRSPVRVRLAPQGKGPHSGPFCSRVDCKSGLKFGSWSSLGRAAQATDGSQSAPLPRWQAAIGALRRRIVASERAPARRAGRTVCRGSERRPLKVARIRNGHQTEIPLRKPLLEEQERLIGQRGHRCTEYQPPSLREDLSRSATLRHPMWGSEPPQ